MKAPHPALMVVLLLGGLEVLCRAHPAALAAVAHRVHFKLALLHAKGSVDFVALGSSRSNDGLAPALLGLGVGFSACTPSTSLPMLEYFASHVGPQKMVLVEVSSPMTANTPMDVAAEVGSFAGDPLGAWLHGQSALLKARRAFAIDHLPRVGALLTASRFDGSEWFRTRQMLEMFRAPVPPQGVHDDAAWVPSRGGPVDALASDVGWMLEGYERVVASLRAQGARVVLMAPPVGSGWKGDECQPPWVALRAEISRRTGAPLLDFTCAQVDDRWFVDGQHLSSPGRAKFSAVLGEALRALP